MFSICAVFEIVDELKPFPETVAEMDIVSLSLARMFIIAIPSLLVLSSDCNISPPVATHSTLNPPNAVLISGIVTDSFASKRSFQFIPPSKSKDTIGQISTILILYFDNGKSSDNNAISIKPSSRDSSFIVLKYSPFFIVISSGISKTDSSFDTIFIKISFFAYTGFPAESSNWIVAKLSEFAKRFSANDMCISAGSVVLLIIFMFPSNWPAWNDRIVVPTSFANKLDITYGWFFLIISGSESTISFADRVSTESSIKNDTPIRPFSSSSSAATVLSSSSPSFSKIYAIIGNSCSDKIWGTKGSTASTRSSFTGPIGFPVNVLTPRLSVT